MELNVFQVFIGLVLAAGCGFGIAWLIREQALSRSATYASSLEQLLAGTMRDRESALDRERGRVSEARLAQQGQAQRSSELEKELEHREMQVIALRDEAILLARTREELTLRLDRQERLSQEVESKLAARIRELQGHGDGTSGGYRPPGTRGSGAREVAALVAAHENDLAELEARYLDAINQREVEIDVLRQRLRMAETAAATLGKDTNELARAQQRITELEEAQASAPAPTSSSIVSSPEPAKAIGSENRPRPLVSSNGTNGSHAPHRTSGPNRISGAHGSNGTNGAAKATKRRARRPRHAEPDDLKLISGVDGSVEQALHLLGVTSFRQVARWKDKDIDRIARKLYQPAERIRGEGWVDSAREAHSKKYGQDP
jgi:predicted flap endonuclease-1-like 5' DNA nuclease